MDLNIPVFKQLSGCKHLLIAGMGGGFDIFCGLPIYFELQKRGARQLRRLPAHREDEKQLPVDFAAHVHVLVLRS